MVIFCIIAVTTDDTKLQTQFYVNYYYFGEVKLILAVIWLFVYIDDKKKNVKGGKATNSINRASLQK